MMRKSPFLLLEVMIAFGILALAAVPLIYPHLMILKEERAIIKEMNRDFAARNLIAGLLVDLYENNISLKLIEEHGTLEVSKEKLEAVGIPEGALSRAYFQFDGRRKPPKDYENHALHKVDAELNLIGLDNKKATYPVSFLIEKNLQGGEDASK
jgi:hypothetical protein